MAGKFGGQIAVALLAVLLLGSSPVRAANQPACPHDAHYFDCMNLAVQEHLESATEASLGLARTVAIVGVVQSAIFALTLVGTIWAALATRKAANAAALTARAAIAIELPVIRGLSPEDLVHVAEPPPEQGPWGGGVIDGVPGRYSVVSDVRWVNDGRTHALPTRVSVGWQVGAGLSAQPVFQRTTDSPAGKIIRSRRTERIEFAPLCIEATDAQIEAMVAGSEFLWVYARLEYLDFMDDPHSATFCWRWDRPDGVGVHYFERVLHAPQPYTERI